MKITKTVINPLNSIRQTWVSVEISTLWSNVAQDIRILFSKSFKIEVACQKM